MNKTSSLSQVVIVLFLCFFVLAVFPKQVLAYRFVAWADTKSSRSALAELSNQIKALSIAPVFTIYPGDLESDGFTSSGMALWKDAVNGNNNNGIFDITFSVRGNHDDRFGTSGWSNYFNFASLASSISGISNYNELAPDLTFSFDYENSRFIGVDVPGNAHKITSSQTSWIDSQLADAESRGLTHAFLYFHGPVYYVANHPGSVPQDLISVINNHPIVSATFHGHEHQHAWTHINNGRISTVTHEFEQFVTGSAGAGPTACDSSRIDWCMGDQNGFSTIDVTGNSFTISVYKIGAGSPTWTKTFAKSLSGNPPGDATGDGKVDGKDYVIWLNNYNQDTGNGASDGDFNISGTVDGQDYVIWLNNYGKW